MFEGREEREIREAAEKIVDQLKSMDLFLYSKEAIPIVINIIEDLVDEITEWEKPW